MPPPPPRKVETVADGTALSAKALEWCFEALAARFTQTTDPTIDADAVDYGGAPDRFLLLARLVTANRSRFQTTNGLRGETHALIELCQRLMKRKRLCIQILNLLEDRDGSRVEAFVHEVFRDLGVGCDRFVDLPPTPMRVADL